MTSDERLRERMEEYGAEEGAPAQGSKRMNFGEISAAGSKIRESYIVSGG